MMRRQSQKLAGQFIESLIVQEMKQFADSITRIKAKRLMPTGYNEHKN